MTVSMSVGTRLDELIAVPEQLFLDRQPRSRALVERAAGSLAGGVTSSWQISRPQAVWISHGQGGHVWDADGNDYVDLHGGYGVMAVGHAHPAVVAAVRDRVARGTHFAQPTEGGHRGCRGAGQALRPAAVALRQLRHRGHHGRRPPDAGHHRAVADRQGRGLLPRPPRLGAGVGVPAPGGDRAGPRAGQRRRLQRHPGRDHPADR